MIDNKRMGSVIFYNEQAILISLCSLKKNTIAQYSDKKLFLFYNKVLDI